MGIWTLQTLKENLSSIYSYKAATGIIDLKKGFAWKLVFLHKIQLISIEAQCALKSYGSYFINDINEETINVIILYTTIKTIGKEKY